MIVQKVSHDNLELASQHKTDLSDLVIANVWNARFDHLKPFLESLSYFVIDEWDAYNHMLSTDTTQPPGICDVTAWLDEQRFDYRVCRLNLCSHLLTIPEEDAAFAFYLRWR